MPFDIVKLDEHYVGGLVLPGVEPNDGDDKADLLMFTQERVRARGVREVLVLYVCHPAMGWTALVGTRCEGLDDLLPGDSLFRVPAGFFAHVVPENGGDAADCWAQVEKAEKEQRIERSYRGDIAVTNPRGTTGLYISLAGPP